MFRTVRFFLATCLLLSLASCTWCKREFCNSSLSCINIIDGEGFTQTVRSKERLKQYVCVDFEKPQPYQKVLRVFNRDPEGNVRSVITSYYPNSQLKQRLDILNGRAYGSYKEWYSDGTLALECQVVGGIADVTPEAVESWLFNGNCCAWDENAHLKASFYYNKGVLESTGIIYHPNGAVAKVTPFVKGEIIGKEISYYPSGQISEETEFVEGLRDGKAFSYWPDGLLASEEVYRKDLLLSGKYWDHQNNPIGGITDGAGFRPLFKRESLYQIEEYKEGYPDGLVQVFTEDGYLERSYYAKNDLREGEEKLYLPPKLSDPQISTAFVPVDDKEHKLLMTLNWHQDELHGIVKTFYENGNIESQREISHNKRNGLSTAWYRDGSLMFIEEYENDRLAKGQYFKKGDGVPESTLSEGNGMAVLYDGDGKLLHRVCYYQGLPLE